MLEERWLHFVDLTRNFGLARSVRIAVPWLVRREYVVFVRDLSLPLPEAPRTPRSRWTELTVADIPQVHALDPSLSDAEIRRRLAAGLTGLLCWVDDTLAHYRWDTPGPLKMSYLGGLFLRPCPGDFLTGDGFTSPAHRGLGIHSEGVLTALWRARELGCRRSIGMVAGWNVPALRINTEKAGRIAVGRVGFWTSGFAQHYFATGAVRLLPNGPGRRPNAVEVAPNAGLRSPDGSLAAT